MLRSSTVRCYVDPMLRYIPLRLLHDIIPLRYIPLATRGLSDPGSSDPVPATGGLIDPCLDACGVSDPCSADLASCLAARGLSDPGLSRQLVSCLTLAETRAGCLPRVV